MSYNSKYTGEQVEGFLDQIANGEISGGSSVYKWNWNSEMNGTFTEEEFEKLSNADVVYITTGVPDMEMLYSVDGRVVVEDALHLGAHILSFETDTDNSKAAYVESITFIFDNSSKTWNAQVGDAELITNEQLTSALEDKQDAITDLDAIRSGAEKGATALQSVPSEYVTESELVWVKEDGEAGVRLKGTNGTATGNLAISAGDDKTASDGTAFASAASGDHAVAFGFGNTCAGRSTLAQGLYNIVNGKDSVAFGQRNLVNGDQAFAAGQQNEVTTRLGVAIGYKNKATNTDSIAIGYQNTSGGSASVAMGDTCEASGTSSTAMGYKTKATGAYSSTFGENTQATNEGEVAMGLYNKSTTSTDASEQTAFSFGIGTSDTNRTNAFEIKKNGDVYIADKLLSAVATSGSYNDLSNKPTIPVAVTESTVSGWGFTKNTGTYSKPSGGIPKTDLASAVQTSLGKADTALQSYTEQYKGTVTGVKINGTTKNPSSGVVDLGTVITDVSNLATKDEAILKEVIGELVTAQAQALYGGGNVYALPDQANGDEDDILLSHNSVKTINGQSIVGSGNLIIEGGSGGNYVEKERLGETEVAYIQGFDTGNMVYGLPDAVANGDADDYLVSVSNLKTINGESILGSGNIEISGGSGGGSAAYPYVDNTSAVGTTYFTISPNAFYEFGEHTVLEISLGAETSGVANEYLFQFVSGSEATSLTINADIKWTEELVIEPNRIYQVSILKGLASVLSWDSANTALIENHIIYDEGDFMNGGTITFEFPTASELTLTMSMYSSSELIIPQGTTQMTIDWFEPQAPEIISISPTNDSTYKYIFA